VTPTDSLVAKHRGAIEKQVSAREGWQPDSYDIERLADWDQRRLPVLAANTNRVMTGYAPLFAVLPSGSLVSVYDGGALTAILTEVLKSPAAADGAWVARVATMFGHFEQPVGEPVAALPYDPAPPARSTPDVQYARDGDAHRFEFYSYDHERMRLYDCRMTFDGNTVRLDSSLVVPREP
jgi:hypothetical protein